MLGKIAASVIIFVVLLSMLNNSLGAQEVNVSVVVPETSSISIPNDTTIENSEETSINLYVQTNADMHVMLNNRLIAESIRTAEVIPQDLKLTPKSRYIYTVL